MSQYGYEMWNAKLLDYVIYVVWLILIFGFWKSFTIVLLTFEMKKFYENVVWFCCWRYLIMILFLTSLWFCYFEEFMISCFIWDLKSLWFYDLFGIWRDLWLYDRFGIWRVLWFYDFLGIWRVLWFYDWFVIWEVLWVVIDLRFGKFYLWFCHWFVILKGFMILLLTWDLKRLSFCCWLGNWKGLWFCHLTWM